MRYRFRPGKDNPNFGKGLRGPDNPSWKGGRYLEAGYIKVNCPSHPRAHRNAVPEHILVFEKYHRCCVLKWNGVVHHKNEVKTDNRIENLEGMSLRQHIKHHDILKNRSYKPTAPRDRRCKLCRSDTWFTKYGNPVWFKITDGHMCKKCFEKKRYHNE